MGIVILSAASLSLSDSSSVRKEGLGEKLVACIPNKTEPHFNLKTEPERDGATQRGRGFISCEVWRSINNSKLVPSLKQGNKIKCKVLVFIINVNSISTYLSIIPETHSAPFSSKSPNSSDSHAHNEQYTPLCEILTIANGNVNTKVPKEQSCIHNDQHMTSMAA